MKILVLTSTYPKFAGDATAPFIESLVTHTARLGHEIHLVVPEHRDWSWPARTDGITFHRFRYSPLRNWTPWGFSQSLEGGTRIRRALYGLAPLVGLSGVRTCRAIVRDLKIDVVHAHWVIPNGPIAAGATRRSKLPLVITAHGSDVGLAQRSQPASSLARWSMGHADVTTASSQHLLDRLASLGAVGRKLRLVPLGVDLPAFNPDAMQAQRRRELVGIGRQEFVVLGIGRLTRLKGFDYLIRATSLLRDRVPELRLVLAGDGDARDELMRLTRLLGLADRVRFVGMVARSEVPSYYAAADVVAVPTVEESGFVEGLGYVVLEAMSAGRPVVASNVGGLPEVVQAGETGYLTRDRDPEQLAYALQLLARDLELRHRMGQSARARALEAPSWSDVASIWERLYEEVVDSHTRKPGSTEL